MKRIIAIVLATLFALVAAPSANAGGTGDFYKSGSCSPSGGPSGMLEVTNYDSGSGQQYHMDMDSYLSGSNGTRIYAVALYVDGVKQSSWNDAYKSFSDKYGLHTIRGKWRHDNGTYLYCQKTL